MKGRREGRERGRERRDGGVRGGEIKVIKRRGIAILHMEAVGEGEMWLKSMEG